MKAGRIASFVVTALAASALAAPAFGNPDPTTGVKGNQAPTVVVAPTSAAAPDPAPDGFDWSDAAIGAAVALGIAAVGGWTLHVARSRPAEQPLAS